jgi:hypothetical protein
VAWSFAVVSILQREWRIDHLRARDETRMDYLEQRLRVGGLCTSHCARTVMALFVVTRGCGAVQEMRAKDPRTERARAVLHNAAIPTSVRRRRVPSSHRRSGLTRDDVVVCHVQSFGR